VQARWLADAVWAPVSFAAVTLDNQPEELIAPEGAELAFGWAQSSARGRWALYLDGTAFAQKVSEASQVDGFALPALVSPRYAEDERLQIGQKFAISINQAEIWFRVDGIVPYFPTLIDPSAQAIITNLDGLMSWLGARPRAGLYANEVWVDLAETSADQAWLTELASLPDAATYQTVWTTDGVLQSLQTDLLTIGLVGLLLLSFVIAMVLCGVSLATYAGITLQARRTEFAVLQALGWSRLKVLMSILGEQTLVMMTGTVLGLVIGVFLSAQVLPALSRSDSSNILPYSVSADPEGLLFYAGLILILFIVQLLIGSLVIIRQSASTLRDGGIE
jgi:hypothetical protein